jgi:hypothetical protein
MPDSGEYPRDFMNVKGFVEGCDPYGYVSRGRLGPESDAGKAISPVDRGLL